MTNTLDCVVRRRGCEVEVNNASTFERGAVVSCFKKSGAFLGRAKVLDTRIRPKSVLVFDEELPSSLRKGDLLIVKDKPWVGRYDGKHSMVFEIP